ncbi:archaeal fructose-1,6-bisphosphatase and related enzyme of inositol monophosphatase family [Gynuella sunshinyii YC6258]|uniref:Inositol-1-monophosphatase n=2 Tax=Gynuella sunshinyii TaxID=1445505 RepID=A0A0C5UYI5_9GAMM|nr:archaeal fructose-1,6-bisphosphatase and related enzyme of inositol monophosphatase family [Gynuella sunshinyii YC6258]
MSLTELQSWLQLAVDTAQKAGELIRDERQNHSLDVDYKDGIELVTQADKKADAYITSALLQATPEFSILAEESENDLSKAEEEGLSLWVIDPIDGTVNYAHHHYQVAVSIALAVDREVQLGVVHNPFLQETFTAIRGQGAFLNGQRISASTTTELNRAIVATGFPYHKNNLPQLMQEAGAVLQHCADLRRLGSAALDLCWVACGRLDAYYEHQVKPWDMAAGRLIAYEAGAMTGSYATETREHGELSGHKILASSRSLYEPLRALLLAGTK